MGKLIIADDHSLYLEGLMLIIKENTKLEVLAIANNGNEAVKITQQYKDEADLLLLDLHLPDMDAIEIVTKIRLFTSKLKILVLTHQKGNRYLHKLQKLGISGYILKSINKETFLDALRQILEGNEIYSENISNITKEEDLYLKSSVILCNSTKDIILSQREKEILVMVCNEKSSKEIGDTLFISTGTVDTHRKNIMLKIGVTNSIGLVKYALKEKLI